MERKSLWKAKPATVRKTSRGQADRFLGARDVPPAALQRAAALVGRKLHIELV
jgi:antitoxin HicB